MSSPRRFHALDRLRAVAMVLGIVLHGAIAYSTAASYLWPVQDRSRSVGADLLFHWIHSFRMPLFFILSGFFARMVSVRVGRREFLRRRWRRVGLPLLLGVFTLSPLSVLVADWAKAKAGPPPANVLAREFWNERETHLQEEARRARADGIGSDPLGGWARWLGTWRYLSLGSLWFLYYLLVFFVVIPRAARWVGGRLGDGRVARVDQWMGWAVGSARGPSVLAVFTLPFLFFMLNIGWGLGTPLAIFVPFPLFALVPEVQYYGYYGLMFSLGWLLQRQPERLGEMARWWRVWLAAGMGCFLTAFMLSETYFMRATGSLLAVTKVMALTAYALATIYLCLGWMGVFMRFGDRESVGWRYLADASFWLYLAHLPVVVVFQVALAAQPWPWPIKLTLLIVGSTAILLGIYHWAVRSTWVGRRLSGERRGMETGASIARS